MYLNAFVCVRLLCLCVTLFNGDCACLGVFMSLFSSVGVSV